MVTRARWPHLAALLGLALGAACSLYTPTFRDCAVSCGEGGLCPAGTTCNEGFCRPNGFAGACDCTPGDEQVCGGGRGECRAGARRCLDTRIWGACLGEVRPSAEVCDGKDNDCDGFIDEDVIDAPACPLSQGVCAQTSQQCLDGGYVDTCGPATYGPAYEVSEQTCDGLDNDCDGVVDARTAVRLATDVNAWTVEALDTGYLLFTTVVGTPAITVQELDAQLRPVGSARSLLTGVEVSTFRTRAAAGDTAAIGYRRTDGTIAMARVQAGSAPPTTISTAAGGTTTSWALAVQPGGAVLGAFERDGGLELHRWAPGATTSTPVPWTPRFPVTKVTALTLSRQAEVLAWEGDLDPMDGGSTTTVGGVEHLDGGAATANTGIARSEVVVTPTRVQAVYDFSSYLPFAFPLSINESGVRVCFDALANPISWTTIARVQDHMQIRDATGVRLQAEMLVGWTEAKTLQLGTALPSVGQVRSRAVQVPGGTVADYALAAGPQSRLVAVFYRSQADPTSVFGTLMCPP